MNKCHTHINWTDNTDPPLNATNLLQIDGELDTLDDRVVALANDPPENALKAEGWAIGEQGGVPVTSGSPYFENNSKFYSEQSAAENLAAEGYANGTQGGVPVSSGIYYHNNAKYWKDQAQAIAGGSAAAIAYDNSESGLTATNVQDAVDELVVDKVEKSELSSIVTTGATNTTGAKISNGTYFYLNGVLVRALADIASGASYTLNTNYEVVTAGGLNDLCKVTTGTCKSSATYTSGGAAYTMALQKRNGIVTFEGFAVAAGVTAKTWHNGVLETPIPEEFRPISEVMFRGTSPEGNGFSYRIHENTGQMDFRVESSSTQTHLQSQVMWFANR